MTTLTLVTTLIMMTYWVVFFQIWAKTFVCDKFGYQLSTNNFFILGLTSITSETDVGVSLQSYSLTTFSCCNAVNSFNILISFVNKVWDLAIFFFVILFIATTLLGGWNESTKWLYLNSYHVTHQCRRHISKLWVSIFVLEFMKWWNSKLY